MFFFFTTQLSTSCTKADCMNLSHSSFQGSGRTEAMPVAHRDIVHISLISRERTQQDG